MNSKHLFKNFNNTIPGVIKNNTILFGTFYIISSFYLITLGSSYTNISLGYEVYSRNVIEEFIFILSVLNVTQESGLLLTFILKFSAYLFYFYIGYIIFSINLYMFKNTHINNIK